MLKQEGDVRRGGLAKARKNRTNHGRFYGRTMLRAGCVIVAFIGIASFQLIRAQQDTGRERQLLAPDNSEDGLLLQRRGSGAVQTTLAAIKGRGLPVGVAASAPAHERARTFLRSHAVSFGLRSASDIALKQENPRDEVEMEHVRFQQLFKGVPVTGGEILIHLKGDRVVYANSELLTGPDVDTTPVLVAEQALDRARAVMRRLNPNAADAPVFSNPKLEVFNRGILEDGVYPTRLSWFIEAKAERNREFIWVDARTGGILLHFNQLTTALNREIYTADSGPKLPGRLIRVEGGPPTEDSDADLAYLYTGDTYQYYLDQHGRDSFDGAGAKLISTVHACPADEGCPWQNAAWDGTQMVYGSGFARADDVTAHELTHAVTERTANLFYYMQSGALNESYSDIFGETIDLTNQHGNDSPSVRWQLGEDMPMGTIRDMRNPWAYGQPGKVSDPQWQHDPTQDAGGVHTNSGVPNLAYALMVDGGSFNGHAITGIGLTAAAKIQYRALTKYLTSGANFLDNYNALLQSCQDLIGVAGITTNTCAQVKEAIEGVEMNRAVLFNSPAPGFCPAGQTVAPLFQDNFETPSGRWTTRALQGTGTWVVPDTGWAKSGTQMAWGQDFDHTGDAVLEMATGFTLPPSARLQFNHAYAFEEGPGVAYDGGVIEYSADGSGWLDAGNLIAGGDPYDPRVPIDSNSGNPLANRKAFVGNSYGYTATQLDLSTLAGRNVRFRFRVGTDEAVGNIGWVVDDVLLYSCLSQNCTYSVNPGSVSIAAQGGSGSVQVSASSGSCEWQASTPMSWIHLSSTRGTGSGAISFSVDANTSTAERRASLTIAGSTVTVIQAGAQACQYSVTPPSASYTADGGTGTVQVATSGQSCSWQASSPVPWITLSRSNGSDTATISYTVAPNTGTAARTANLTVAGTGVAISQLAPTDTPRSGDLRTSDSADRLNWTYEPNATGQGYVEFKICKVSAITWWKEFVVRSGNSILADFGVKDSATCASQRVAVASLQRGFQMELWKAKFLGIPFQVKVMSANYFGELRPGSRLTVTWLKD